MRMVRIALSLSCLGIGLAGSLPGTEAGEQARSMLPRPREAVPLVQLPSYPGGVNVEQLADALRVLATATLGGARPGSNQHRGGIDLLESAVAGEPAKGAARVPLADAYVDSGNPLAVALACELYAETLQDCPRADSLLARLADACLVLGNDEGALAYAAQRFAGDQIATPAASAQLALIALESGDLRRAAGELERAARETRDPSAAKLGRLLAQAVADSERDAELPRNPSPPAADQEFHDQRLAAMSNSFLSSDERIEMVRAAVRQVLAGERPATGREARPRDAAASSTGRAFVTIQEHRQRLIGIEADSEWEPAAEADRRQQVAGELQACVAAAELTEPQLRYLHRCLGLTCGVEELVGLWGEVRGDKPAIADGQTDGGEFAARIDLWQPLIDACQWAAIQQDWREIRFSMQVMRELAAHPAPVPRLLDAVRAETSGAAAAIKAAWTASRQAERELLAIRRNAWSQRAEEMRHRGISEEAETAASRVAELQQAVRRFHEEVDLNVVIALLDQSTDPKTSLDEPGFVDSGMLMQFKTDMATGTLCPGQAIWFDRAIELHRWFNADQHAETLADGSADDPHSTPHPAAERRFPAARLSLAALVSIVREAAACLEPEDFPGESAAREQLRIVSEVERIQAEATDEAEVRLWLIERLRQLCRQSFRGSADAASAEDGESEQRTDL